MAEESIVGLDRCGWVADWRTGRQRADDLRFGCGLTLIDLEKEEEEEEPGEPETGRLPPQRLPHGVLAGARGRAMLICISGWVIG